MNNEIKTVDIIESLRACVGWDCNDCIARYDGCIIRLKKLAADRLERLSNQHIKVQYRSEELTISEMCGRMDDLREENELLRDALAEMNETSDRTSRDERIMRQAVETYGVQAQCDVAIEEMAELTKALMKTRRVPDDDHAAQEHARSNVIEEIADVEIMIDQLKIMYGEHYVNAVREQKLVRLESRLNDAEKES